MKCKVYCIIEIYKVKGASVRELQKKRFEKYLDQLEEER